MKFLWTTIYVRNMEESITFYSDLLGLQLMKRFNASPGIEIAFLGNGNDNETMVELLGDSKISTVNFTESISIGFAIDSVDDMLETLKIKNISIHQGPFETPSFKYFTIKDPNGLNVQYFQQK